MLQFHVSRCFGRFLESLYSPAIGGPHTTRPKFRKRSKQVTVVARLSPSEQYPGQHQPRTFEKRPLIIRLDKQLVHQRKNADDHGQQAQQPRRKQNIGADIVFGELRLIFLALGRDNFSHGMCRSEGGFQGSLEGAPSTEMGTDCWESSGTR